MKMLNSIIIAASLMLPLIVSAGQPVNINSASATELADGLDGVGLVRAKAIVSYRDEHGSFKTAADLINVKGVGEATLEKNRQNILFSKRNASGKVEQN